MTAESTIKLLIVAPYPVFPLVAGGKIRIVQLARSLSKLGVDVTVLAPFHFTQRRVDWERENFRLRTVKYPFVIPLLFTDRPFPYGYLISFQPGYRFCIRNLLLSFDIYQLEHPAFSGLAHSIRASGKPTVYSPHNVEYDYIRSETPWRAIKAISGKRILALERELILNSSHLFTCSEGDKARFVQLYGTSREIISVIPNGIDGASQRTEDTPHSARVGCHRGCWAFPRQAIFSGSDVAHNRAAVRHILEKLAPRLAREVAFVIHGPCGKRFRRSGSDNVFFEPDHLDLRSYSRPGAVALNPVTQGSGTSMKLLQYLADGLPVISTQFGVRGLGDIADFVTVAPLEDFTDAIRTDHRLSLDVSEALARYEWNNIARTAKKVYSSLLDPQETRP